jgi:hypothetical protein
MRRLQQAQYRLCRVLQTERKQTERRQLLRGLFAWIRNHRLFGHESVKVIAQQQLTFDRVAADWMSLHPPKEAKWWAYDRVGAHSTKRQPILTRRLCRIQPIPASAGVGITIQRLNLATASVISIHKGLRPLILPGRCGTQELRMGCNWHE